MPFIAQQIRHSIFYLFDSEQAAMENSRDGGSGFFVFTRTSSGHPVFYAVTNTHVIKDGFSVIRVNTGDGKFGTITPTEWLSHPDGADVSVAIVENYDRNLGFSGLPAEWLLPERLLNFEVVHLGADVYMVGRFVLRAGTNTNEPVARSGILSAFPDRANTIKLNGVEKPQEAFLMEMRSLSGFSGSPTFYNLSVREFIGHLKIAMDVVYNVQVPGNTRYAERPELGVYILGIDAGAFSMYEDVIQQDGTVQYQTTYKAKNHSGFSVVIPAWKIIETLDRPEFEMHRIQKERELASVLNEDVADAHVARSDNAETFTREDFERALTQASQPLSAPDQETKET